VCVSCMQLDRSRGSWLATYRSLRCTCACMALRNVLLVIVEVLGVGVRDVCVCCMMLSQERAAKIGARSFHWVKLQAMYLLYSFSYIRITMVCCYVTYVVQSILGYC
jgi:hypothetical protein